MFSPGQHLLFFSHQIALPRLHGGCVYPHALLGALHRHGVKIDYAWLGQPLSGSRRLMRDPLDAPFIHRGWVRGARKLGRFLVPENTSTLFAPRDTALNDHPQGEHLATRAEQDFAADVIRRSGATAVLIDGTATLGILDTLTPDERAALHVGVLTHNLTSRRTDLYRAHGQPLDFFPMSAAEETALLARADTIVAIQEREAEAFRALLPGHSVITVPMPVEPNPAPGKLRLQPCLFVGGYSGHNLAALDWLLNVVWPLIRAAEPTAELIVAGTVGQSVVTPPAGVRIVGAVTDLKALYAETCVSLVPLPMGTGLKIKLVEAMGYGNAVVTTSAGAEGYPALESGQIAVIADEALPFAAAVVTLLWRPSWRERVAQRQLRWVRDTLNADRVIAPLAALWSPAPAAVAAVA